MLHAHLKKNNNNTTRNDFILVDESEVYVLYLLFFSYSDYF